MSAYDVIRSLSESREEDRTIVGACLTYGQVRQLVAEIDTLRKRLRVRTAQRDTAYGYGGDDGAPPWMR